MPIGTGDGSLRPTFILIRTAGGLTAAGFFFREPVKQQLAATQSPPQGGFCQFETANAVFGPNGLDEMEGAGSRYRFCHSHSTTTS